MSRTAPALLVPMLAGGLSSLLLAGCTSSPSGANQATSGSARRTLGSTTCVDSQRSGARLGLTLPAGFVVDPSPPGASVAAAAHDVNLLTEAYRFPSGAQTPDVQVKVYGYGPDDAGGAEPLGRSVQDFAGATDGVRESRITATPTTVAGVAGSAGTGTGNRALGGAATPIPLRWWTLTVDRTRFVVVLGSITPALDQQVSTDLLSGLHPGGCPSS